MSVSCKSQSTASWLAEFARAIVYSSFIPACLHSIGATAQACSKSERGPLSEDSVDFRNIRGGLLLPSLSEEPFGPLACSNRLNKRLRCKAATRPLVERHNGSGDRSFGPIYVDRPIWPIGPALNCPPPSDSMKRLSLNLSYPLFLFILDERSFPIA